MSFNNVIPWWMLGPCKFRQNGGTGDESDFETCTVCGRQTRFRVELMKHCVSEDLDREKFRRLSNPPKSEDIKK